MIKYEEKQNAIKALYNNTSITQAGDYEDLNEKISKYIKAGMQLTIMNSSAKYDTALGYLIKENAPIRKFRYNEMEIQDEDRIWMKNFNEAKAKGKEELLKISQQKEQDRLDKYYRERKEREDAQNKEQKTE